MTPSSPEPRPLATNVSADDEYLIVDLADGRKLYVPLSWYPLLFDATPEQRANWELLGIGEGIHWPEIDEDLSVAGLLRGSPAPGRRAS